MSKGQTLRVLVNERLTAAAEEIFALFERTIAEFEEELCRSKEENQRKQELLDSVLNPRVVLHRAGVQIPSTTPGPGLNQGLNQGLDQGLDQGLNQEIPQIKEEQSVKQEEQQVQISEFSAVCVKTEESSLLQQRQTEPREETQGEDISAETVLHSETEGDTEHSSDADNEDWRAPFSSASQMETEANRDHHNQETSDAVNSDMSGRAKRTRTTHQCPMCQKIFYSRTTLQYHIRVHTEEKPYSCSVCRKRFIQKGNLDTHLRIHTGERPYSCSRCSKKFVNRSKMRRHMKTHRPYCA